MVRNLLILAILGLITIASAWPTLSYWPVFNLGRIARSRAPEGGAAWPTLSPRQDDVVSQNGTWPPTRTIPVKEVGCWGETINMTNINIAKERLGLVGISHRIKSGSYLGQVYCKIFPTSVTMAPGPLPPLSSLSFSLLFSSIVSVARAYFPRRSCEDPFMSSRHRYTIADSQLLPAREAVWICNCKRFKKDHVVASELDEAEAIVALRCGEGVSGYVWSSKWQKSFNYATRSMFLGHRHPPYGGGTPKHIVPCPKFCLKPGHSHGDQAEDADNDPDHDPDKVPDNNSDEGEVYGLDDGEQVEDVDNDAYNDPDKDPDDDPDDPDKVPDNNSEEGEIYGLDDGEGDN
ncbi:hypothetical protein F4859DRAFT_529930 [Xylaria cf. heliscus]|nr:hypothetical protein F4859DRAFT_529930 [Xylaria cf. heliscus]